MRYDSSRSRPNFDTAMICTKGHVITTALALHPEFKATRFCAECGSQAITKCPGCEETLRGYHPTVSFNRPSFCHGCSDPLPWTAASLEAANELADSAEELSDDDRRMLREHLPELLVETPRTSVAIVRVKRVLGKAGPGIRAALGRILSDLVTEGAKKALGL